MRADRLISLIMHLQVNGRMTARELAERLEVSERTIYRDIEALSVSGIPIQSDAGHGGGIRLLGNYRTRMDGLNSPEVQALFLLMNEQPLQRLGIHQSLRSALLKLLHNLSDAHRQDADWVRNRVLLDMESWQPRAEQPEVMEAARRAVWEQRQAEVVYVDRYHRRFESCVQPYGLVMRAGIWFLVAQTAEEMRAYRLLRFESFRLLEERFERPEGLDLQACWQAWFQRYETRRSQYSVRVLLSQEALHRLADLSEVQGWRQEAVREDGLVELELGFENPDMAVAAILGLGDHVCVLAPNELRERLCSVAERLLARYRTDAGFG